MVNYNVKTLSPDLLILADLISDNSKVLDVGCGSGELLCYLKNNKNISGRGIEINNQLVAKAIKKGLAVMQGDADNDLKHYPSDSFDYVVLSQTLQATKHPDLVLKELKRIAKYILVSVPNFGYYENRLYLALKGKMPVTKTLSYEWYDTPNIHFCTIADFKLLCKKLEFAIVEEVYINNDLKFFKFIQKTPFIPNLLAKYGVFLLTRGELIKISDKSKVNLTNNQKLSLCYKIKNSSIT
jgi:methionine biosynthesis protein MetW